VTKPPSGEAVAWTRDWQIDIQWVACDKPRHLRTVGPSCACKWGQCEELALAYISTNDLWKPGLGKMQPKDWQAVCKAASWPARRVHSLSFHIEAEAMATGPNEKCLRTKEWLRSEIRMERTKNWKTTAKPNGSRRRWDKGGHQNMRIWGKCLGKGVAHMVAKSWCDSVSCLFMLSFFLSCGILSRHFLGYSPVALWDILPLLPGA
jgi:hypothetical protein